MRLMFDRKIPLDFMVVGAFKGDFTLRSVTLDILLLKKPKLLDQWRESTE